MHRPYPHREYFQSDEEHKEALDSYHNTSKWELAFFSVLAAVIFAGIALFTGSQIWHEFGGAGLLYAVFAIQIGACAVYAAKKMFDRLDGDAK